jgi:hypothetical protein
VARQARSEGALMPFAARGGGRAAEGEAGRKLHTGGDGPGAATENTV